MKIEIKNCNNVHEGVVTICPDTLNIKYALNGTGKSTLVSAIVAGVNNDSAKLKKLTPFSEIATKGSNGPMVSGCEGIKSVKVFNEEYVDSYLFTKDDLLKDSFQVLIKTENYKKQEDEIREKLKMIKTAFEGDAELDALIVAFESFLFDYGKAKKLSKNSGIAKGLAKGNKLRNVPKELKMFSAFLQGEKTSEWLEWHAAGRTYGESTEQCPYCTTETKAIKPVIEKLEAEYNPEEVRYLCETIKTFARFLEYFSEPAVKMLKELLNNASGITSDQEKFLEGLRAQVEGLKSKLTALKFVKFATFKDIDDIAGELLSMQIDVSEFPCLSPEKVIGKVERINKSVTDLLGEAGVLKGKIKCHQNYVNGLVSKYEKQINDFLTKAGFRYKVSIVARKIEGEAEDEYRMVIRHRDVKNEDVKRIEDHLSFGERNAFALALFVVDAVASKAELVILDDPVSSFDGEKKFALLDMLFWGKSVECFMGKTVLMMTHDFSPVIDVIRTMRTKFPKHSPMAHYLVNHNGVVAEKEITQEDISSARKIAEDAISSTKIDVLRLIYLRRLIEIDGIQGAALDAYNMISSLLKKRNPPTVDKDSNSASMTAEAQDNATAYIKGYIPDFQYEKYLGMAKDDGALLSAYKGATSNYEKLQIFRIVHGVENCESVMKKFVNESYHIENDYLFSLSPLQYETVPQYVIDGLNSELSREGVL